MDFFSWTLTHRCRAFTRVQPQFDSKQELLNYLERTSSESLTELAERRIIDEWRAWVKVHEESKRMLSEEKLDNTLMRTLYRLILERDFKRCFPCHRDSDLTIHHIIPKQRNVLEKLPPFGRSVPTNLITLCRKCHYELESEFLLGA